MPIRPIMTAENPLLRKKAKKVTRFGDGLENLIKDMFDTMHAANGLGIAAPQVGVSQRVFIVELPAEYDDDGKEIAPNEVYVLVNPEIVKAFGEEEAEEGCLSVPGYRGLVTRPARVTIKGYDLRGKEVRHRAEGLLAQAFQHERDHLDGVLFLDYLDDMDKLWRIDMDEEGQSRSDE